MSNDPDRWERAMKVLYVKEGWRFQRKPESVGELRDHFRDCGIRRESLFENYLFEQYAKERLANRKARYNFLTLYDLADEYNNFFDENGELKESVDEADGSFHKVNEDERISFLRPRVLSFSRSDLPVNQECEMTIRPSGSREETPVNLHDDVFLATEENGVEIPTNSTRNKHPRKAERKGTFKKAEKPTTSKAASAKRQPLTAEPEVPMAKRLRRKVEPLPQPRISELPSEVLPPISRRLRDRKVQPKAAVAVGAGQQAPTRSRRVVPTPKPEKNVVPPPKPRRSKTVVPPPVRRANRLHSTPAAEPIRDPAPKKRGGRSKKPDPVPDQPQPKRTRRRALAPEAEEPRNHQAEGGGDNGSRYNLRSRTPINYKL
ncbi:unnamed protein product [Bursaphelenchus xylophilus]|uniref:(pine wood nematode) hypothetical protein n=1 Tax=Bursaphelenchus xylophilus TaxID=6326 RepID=A0A1I7RSX5_BURXY|nr:unnamed protein product [Bursaphelenchus xylophilus]CAG9122753.1 unnamed protein product [Bursaphelenchus xylophilus]